MQKIFFEQVIVLDKFWINQQMYFWLLNNHSIFLVKFIKCGYINPLNINRLTILIIKNDGPPWRKQILHSKESNLSKMNRIIRQTVGSFLVQIVNRQRIPEHIYQFCFQTLTKSFKLANILRILLWMTQITGIKIPCQKWKKEIKVCFKKLKNQQLNQLLKEINDFCHTNRWNVTKINAWLLVGFWYEQLIFEAGLIIKRNFYDEIQSFIQELVD